LSVRKHQNLMVISSTSLVTPVLGPQHPLIPNRLTRPNPAPYRIKSARLGFVDPVFLPFRSIGWVSSNLSPLDGLKNVIVVGIVQLNSCVQTLTLVWGPVCNAGISQQSRRNFTGISSISHEKRRSRKYFPHSKHALNLWITTLYLKVHSVAIWKLSKIIWTETWLFNSY